jgi:hypothetical protein
MKVCDGVGKSGDCQLAGAVDATRSSHSWMVGEHPDVPDNFEHGIDRCAGVVTVNGLLDPVEVAASGVRPL